MNRNSHPPRTEWATSRTLRESIKTASVIALLLLIYAIAGINDSP